MLEKRRHERVRSERAGALIWNSGQASADCVVINLSVSGACVRVSNTVGIPDEFYLSVDDGSMKWCRVAWRTTHRLGISYE